MRGEERREEKRRPWNLRILYSYIFGAKAENIPAIQVLRQCPIVLSVVVRIRGQM
jgi:hypothetical protein